MRYGLDNDKGYEQKREWKTAMEREMTSMKFEISILKEQLEHCTNKIAQLSTNTIGATNGLTGQHNTCYKNDIEIQPGDIFDVNCNKNYLEKNKNDHNFQIEPIFSNVNTILFGPQHPQGLGTRAVTYQATPDVDLSTNKPTQMITITAMPEYNNWSLEELRVMDSAIADRTQHLQFVAYGLKGQFTGTGLVRYCPIWSFDSITGTPNIHHCITVMLNFYNKSLEELRLEDYIMKRNKVSKQMKYKYSKLRFPRIRRYHMTSTHENSGDQSWSKDMITDSVQDNQIVPENFVANPIQYCSNGPEPRIAPSKSGEAKQEEMLSQLLSMVSKIDSQLSYVNSHQAIIGSRLSVMDSRLSAVDMFVTMQRVDKQWLHLQSRLTTLETALPSSEMMDTSQRVKSNDLFGTPISVNINDSKSLLDSSSMDLSNYNKHIYSSKAIEVEDTQTTNLSSELNTLGSPEVTQSVNFNSSSSINNSSFEVSKFEENGQAMKCARKTDLDIKSEKNSLESGREIENKGTLENIPSQVSGQSLLNLSDQSKPTIMIENKVPGLGNEVKKPTLEKNTSDEDEFVVVSKEDVVCLTEPYSEEKVNFLVGSQSLLSESGSKLFSDITEYLEVNIGKKKDSVYPFGFKANPECIRVVTDSCTNSPLESHTIAKASKDEDSFFTFLTSFAEDCSRNPKEISTVLDKTHSSSSEKKQNNML